MEPTTLPASAAASPPSPPPLPSVTSTASTLPALQIAAPGVQERDRIRDILNSPEASGREGLARMLAFETDHDPATARRIMNAAPQQVAPAPAQPTSFERQMARIPNPIVGAAGAGGEEDSPAAEAGRVLAFVAKERKVS